MHVYMRDQFVDLAMKEVEAEGLIATDSGLIPMAFYADGNERPSFRAFLPADTVTMLQQVLNGPVQLGLMADEPEDPAAEIQAMVGLMIPVDRLPEGMSPGEAESTGGGGDEPDLEPWQQSGAWQADAWKEGDADEDDDEEGGRTILLAFAPLVRIARKHPGDFAEELADLLESALAGATKPSLEARVDRMLGL